MHKNTLRYRLKRLTEVLGRDPAEPDAKFHLRMAFDLVDLFAGMGIDVLPPTARRSWGTAAGVACRSAGAASAAAQQDVTPLRTFPTAG